MTADRPLLTCRALRKAFPGVVALDAVDFDVCTGQVVALVGENGAGKTTLVKLLSGVHRLDSGAMTYAGQPFAPPGPAEAMDAGIAMVHQETNLLLNMSVADNIFLGRQPLRAGLVDYQALRRATRQQLERVGLADLDPDTLVGRLAVAARQKVEIAKALALDARLLILDEPTAALPEDDAEILFRLIDDLKTQGVAFVYITHRLGEVRRVADRVVVLRDGRRVAEFDDPTVDVDEFVRVMVGREVTQVYPEPPEPAADEVLHVAGLTRAGAFEDISFTVRAGEVLGIAGLVGAGRTEVVRALAGADSVDAGEVRVDGRLLRLRSPEDALRAGIVLVPEDRKEQGLVLDLSLRDNVALPSLRKLAVRGVVRLKRVTELVRDVAGQLDLRGRPEQPARTLSGGNQQKAVIAKWLPREPRVVIFDEPTRGIDVGAKQAIYALIQRLASRGVAVVVISSELPEVLGLAHRVLVLAKGRLTGELARSEATEEAVMQRAVSV